MLQRFSVENVAAAARHFGDALDGLLDGPLGGQARPTTIRDALTGATVRA